MKILLATWLERSQAESLTKLGYENRLLSFYFLKEKADQIDLETYIKEGTWKEEDKKPKKPLRKMKKFKYSKDSD